MHRLCQREARPMREILKTTRREMANRTKRSILITGGGQRIGAALVRSCAREGWFVAVHCHASVKEAETLVGEIRAAGGAGKVVSADLSNPAAIPGLLLEARRNAPPLIALVNNASVFEYDAVGSLNAEGIDRHLAVNLRAPVLLSQAFNDTFGDGYKDDGCIINILDNKVFAVNPDYFSYTVSKFGLHGATLAMAMAMAPRLRVNAIAPGITLESGGQGEKSFRDGQRMSPIGRVCSADDIANALSFILSTPSLNGHVITVDGGQTLQRLPRDVAFLGGGG